MDPGPSSFRCSFEGCTKTFTRKDHLFRHAANHSTDTFNCPRCTRPFKRIDLLHRHQRRNICGDEPYKPPASSSAVKRKRSKENLNTTTTSNPRSEGNEGDDELELDNEMDPPVSAISNTFPHSASTTTTSISNNTDSSMAQGQGQGQSGGGGINAMPTSTTTTSPFNTTSLSGPSVYINTTTNNDLIQSTSTAAAPSAPEFGFGFGLWAPEQWEALLHESLLPPFNEPIIPNMNFDYSNTTNTNSNTYDQQTTYFFNPQPQPQPQTIPPPTATTQPILPPILTQGKIQLQSSSERDQVLYQPTQDTYGVNGAGAGAGAGREDVSMMETLLSRLQMSFPELDISLSFMCDSLDLYWSKTSPTFPFIHQPTFDYSTAPSELIVLMIIVGSVHSSSNHQPQFSKLVSKIRSMLFQECGLEMPISTLQSFTLCHVYDTWYGNSESLFVAQCMWPVMVAHSRKKGIGVLGKPDLESQQEEAWTNWAKEEERRRSAYCVLLIDTQLSAFWNQHCSRQLSIFAHNLNLPCPKSQWEATNASEWVKIRQYTQTNTPTTKPKHSKSGYLPGLHPEFTVNVVTEGYSSAIMSALSEEHKFLFKVDLDHSLTSQMVLIGLIAIAWDCRTRGGMGIRFREGTKHWRSIVFNAVIQLRAAYESAVMHMSASIESRDMRDTFAICIISVLSDIPMLHVAAGATSFCGASIGPRQYSDAKRRLKLWAKTDDAWTCVWQSVRYLRQALFSEWGLYSPWAVFNTTLVLWGYTTTTIPPSAPSTSTSTLTDTTSTSTSTATYPPPPTTTTAFTFTSSASSLSVNNDVDRQRRLTTWLEGVLGTHGKLEAVDNLDEIIRDLLEIVCEKLGGAGGEVDRGNGILLGRLIGQRRGSRV